MIKYMITILAIGMLTITSYAQDMPKMTFEMTEYNFKIANQGDVIEHTFKFKNTGKAPLIISDVKTTCGCTVPKWPQNPIQPGQSEAIDVKFDTKGKSGIQNKVVTIVTNTKNGNEKVVLKGIIEIEDKKKK